MEEDDEENSIHVNKKRKSENLDDSMNSDDSEMEEDNDDIIKGKNFKNVKKKNKIDDDSFDTSLNNSTNSVNTSTTKKTTNKKVLILDEDYEMEDEDEDDEIDEEAQTKAPVRSKSKKVRRKSSDKSQPLTSTQEMDYGDDEGGEEEDDDDEDNEDEGYEEEDDSKQSQSKKKSKYIPKKREGTTGTSNGGVSNKSTPTSTNTTPVKITRSASAKIEPKVEEETKPATVQYHCDYCQKDISGVVRIRCAECQDFDLCLECFSVGVEVTPHKNSHGYMVVDNMHFPMFTLDWGADEELLLLEAIELYGMGNWNDISENVGTKSPQECKSHYFTYYLNTTTSPLPDTAKVLTTKETCHTSRAIPTINTTVNDRNTRDKSKSKTGGKSVSTDHHDGPSGPVTDSVGFMKNRGHFEVEFDNDAEIVVKDLTFDADDTQSDRETKLSLLESYSQRLDERVRRRNFVVEKGLLDYKKLERKRIKEDKDIVGPFKAFLQLLSKEDYGKLVDGVLEERNLKNRIVQLQKYRENGLRYLNEGVVYDEDKRKRDLERSNRRSKSDLSSFSNSDKPFKTQKQIIKEKEDIYLGITSSNPNGSNGYINPSGGKISSKNSKSTKNVQAEMEQLPNSDLLSIKEKQLCSMIRLLPQQYLLVKETILSESLKTNGSLKASTAQKLSKLNPLKLQKVYDFLEQNNYLKKIND